MVARLSRLQSAFCGLLLLLACLICNGRALPAARAAESSAAILVVGDVANPGALEQAIQGRLQALGYAVALRDRGSFAEAEAWDVALVVIAPGADPIAGSIVDLARIPVPIIALNEAAIEGLGLGRPGDVGVASRQKEMRIASSLHPLAAGMFGSLGLSPTPQDVRIMRARGAGKSVLAAPDDANASFEMAFEKGDATSLGPAPARRVGVAIPSTFMGGTAREAKDLFVAAVYWATKRNAPPWLFPGQDVEGTVGQWVLLDGRVSDDGLPGDTSVLSQWSKVAGPGTVEFEDGSSSYRYVRFSKAGTYSLRLSATDGAQTSSATIVATIGEGSSSAGAVKAVRGGGGDEGRPGRVNNLATGSILFVVENYATSLGAADTAVKDRLTALGYSVTVAKFLSNGVSPNPPADPAASAATGKKAVIISPSAGNSVTQFEAVAVPVLVMTDGLCDNYHVCDFSNRGTTVDASVRIANSEDYLAGGLEDWIFVTNVSDSISGGGVTNAARKIATFQNDPTKAAVAGYETGSLMFDGVTAPAKRGMFGLTPLQIANANDWGAVLFDQMALWLGNQNVPPVAKAGADFTALYPGASLDGVIQDDGQPNPPAQITATWDFWSSNGAAGTATIVNPTCTGTVAAQPTCLKSSVTFTSDGLFTLRLSASDGEYTRYDYVDIDVRLENQPPSVDLGPDRVVLHPGSLSLHGVVADDGLPTSSLVYTWSQVSGPPTVVFPTGNSPDKTVSLPAPGTYVLRLAASDGLLSGYDDIVVTAGEAALLVVNDEDALTPEDLSEKSLIESIGLSVTYISTSQSFHARGRVINATEAAAAAAGRRFVLIGQSVNAADLTNQFKTVAVPVICTANSYQNPMGMIVAAGANHGNTLATASDAMVLNSPTHVLSAGLVGTIPTEFLATAGPWSNPPATAIKIATEPGLPTHVTWFAFEKNVVMSGFTAPERRVAVNMNWTNYTPAAKALIRAAMMWAGRINQMPIVDAGPARQTTATTAFLDGTVLDDGLVLAVPTYQWSLVSPTGAAVTIASPTQVDTNVTLPGVGDYVFRLTANDGALSASDTVLVSVNPSAGVTNQAPIINAGPDRAVTPPNVVALHASYSDDGLPAPPNPTVLWTQVSGPSTVTFTPPTADVVDVVAAFTAPGIYRIRLAVGDGALTAVDEVLVTVAATRQALVVTNLNSPAGEEVLIKARLESLGFTVATAKATTVTTAVANTKALVYVPSSISSGDLAGNIRSTTTPVIVAENEIFNAMKMTGPTSGTDFGLSTAQSQLAVTMPSHPLAAGVPTPVAPCMAPCDMGWGKPGVNAVQVAVEPTSPTHAMIFGYSKGQLMTGTSVADGRRVGFFARGQTLSESGWSLFDAAVNWATTPEVQALFVVGSTTPAAGSGDDLILNRLRQLGFSVTMKTGSAVNNGADLSLKALVVISSTVTPTDVAAKFLSSTVPVMVLESNVFDDMKMTGLVSGTDFGVTTGQSAITIVDSAHSLAAGLPQGATTVLSSAQSLNWGIPSASAAKVATIVGAPTHWSIFGYELGASMVGQSAPDRRVAFLLDSTTPTALNASGWMLFEAAARWAAGSDADNDGLDIFTEYKLGTDPRDSDSNDNGIPDGIEKGLGLDPANTDSDGDGLTNAQELQKGTDPFRADTDNDALGDATDCYPLDLTRAFTCPGPSGTDTVPPAITLLEPPGATFTGAVCTPSPCPP